jgi:hypothetical protein
MEDDEAKTDGENKKPDGILMISGGTVHRVCIFITTSTTLFIEG